MSEKYCIGCGAAYGQEHATTCVKYIKPADEVPFTYEDECKLRQKVETLKVDLTLEKESSARNDANSFDQIRALSDRAEKAEVERDGWKLSCIKAGCATLNSRNIVKDLEDERDRLREAGTKVVNQWRRRNMMGIVIDELENAINHKEP